MRCFSYLVFLAVLSASAHAQDFPEPGTGVYSWSTVGPDSRPLKLSAIAFAQDGTLFGGSSDSSYVYVPGPTGAPSGRWRALGYANPGVGSLLPLGPRGDTLVGSGSRGALWLFSTDGGVTMNFYDGDGPRRPGAILEMPPGHPHAGRIAAGGTAHFSDNRGRTWTRTPGPTPGGLGPSALGFALLPSGRLLYASDGVLTSDDGGASYELTSFYAAFQFQVTAIAAVATPGSVQAGAPACGLANSALCEGAIAVGVEVPNDGLFAWRTSDGGRSWSAPISLPQPYDGVGYSLAAGVLDAGPGPSGLGRAVAILARGIIYVTADGGQTWTVGGRMPVSLSGNEYVNYAMLGPDGHIWVVMEQLGPAPQRVLRSDQPVTAGFTVAGEAAPETGAARVDLFPNPAGDRMSVRVSPARPSPSVRVQVVDALGRPVATVHDGPLTQGEHVFALDTSTLPAGVYLVRVEGAGRPSAARFTVAR